MCDENPNKGAVIKVIAAAKNNHLISANDLIRDLTLLVDAAYIQGLADGKRDYGEYYDYDK